MSDHERPNLRKVEKDEAEELELIADKSTGRSWAHTVQVIFVTAIVFAFLAYLASLGML